MNGGGQPGPKQIVVKSPEEIAIMREANQIVAETLAKLIEIAEPGLSTYDLDQVAESICTKHKAVPAFKGYHGFPASLCVSINEEVVHGIPSRKRKLKKGDIVSVDFGVCHRGFYGDSAVTIPVGRVSKKSHQLMCATEHSLELAIEQVRVGNRIADISAAVQNYVEPLGYTVVK
ncbi:MAG: type I methionyl aminopeptidase, partial [Thermodesulfobacteriota bacterium]